MIWFVFLSDIFIARKSCGQDSLHKSKARSVLQPQSLEVPDNKLIFSSEYSFDAKKPSNSSFRGKDENAQQLPSGSSWIDSTATDKQTENAVESSVDKQSTTDGLQVSCTRQQNLGAYLPKECSDAFQEAGLKNSLYLWQVHGIKHTNCLFSQTQMAW